MKNDRIQSWFGVTSHWNSVIFNCSCYRMNTNYGR